MSHHVNRLLWQANFTDRAPDPMVLGLDIGGTKMHWATFRVVDGLVTHEIIAEGEMPTPKGPRQLINAYSQILGDALKNSPGHYLAGVGVASPGRFVEATEEARGISLKTAARDWVAPQKSRLSMMGKGSAFNMWREGKVNDFDHVALESAFRRSTPRGIPVVVENDAAAQMQGFAYQLSQNGSRPAIEEKKLVYIGPGTGLGTAVRNGSGEVTAYGYYQEMVLGQRPGNEADQAVFAAAHAIALEKEQTLPPEKPRLYATRETPAIQAEDLLSGTGLGKLLSTIVPEATLPRDAKGRFDLRAFDKAYIEYRDTGNCAISNMEEAVAYLDAAGRYLGDMLVKLHSGVYEPLDPTRHMGKSYHDAAKGFQTVLFGGGVSGAAFYRDRMVPQAKEIMQDGKVKAEIILPKRPDLEAAYAAASQIDMQSLARNAQELNTRMKNDEWRTVLYDEIVANANSVRNR